MPPVSVIVPVYNVEKYLPKCLNSLVNQTLDGIEIIVVNDGSPDNSQMIIDEYESKYPETIKSYIKENGGLGSARNYGLERAKGEYIGFIDSDDYVKPYMFEKLYAKAKEKNAELVICDLEFVDEKRNILQTTEITSHKNLDIAGKKYALAYGRNEAFNKLYHKDLFFKTGIRYPKGWSEDYPTTPLLIESANNIAYVPEPLMYYLQRSDSLMGQSQTFKEHYFDILKGTERLIENKHIFNDEDFEFFMNRIAPVHCFLKYFLNIIRIHDRKKRKHTIAKWGEELNRLIPRWYKSQAIKERLKNATLVKRWAILLVIWAFRFKWMFPANLVRQFIKT